MSKAMAKIVQVYVRHQNRRALEDLSKQRQKLALELRARARPGYDFGVPIRQITEEIAVIEAGLKRLLIAAKAA
jgi:protein involved in polysaccharide export with SLBB domain